MIHLSLQKVTRYVLWHLFVTEDVRAKLRAFIVTNIQSGKQLRVSCLIYCGIVIWTDKWNLLFHLLPLSNSLLGSLPFVYTPLGMYSIVFVAVMDPIYLLFFDCQKRLLRLLWYLCICGNKTIQSLFGDLSFLSNREKALPVWSGNRNRIWGQAVFLFPVAYIVHTAAATVTRKQLLVLA